MRMEMSKFRNRIEHAEGEDIQRDTEMHNSTSEGRRR